jgi:hypothetical protein
VTQPAVSGLKVGYRKPFSPSHQTTASSPAVLKKINELCVYFLETGKFCTVTVAQVESALRRIGQGKAVLSVSRSLHCATATLYRAIAAAIETGTPSFSKLRLKIEG